MVSVSPEGTKISWLWQSPIHHAHNLWNIYINTYQHKINKERLSFLDLTTLFMQLIQMYEANKEKSLISFSISHFITWKSMIFPGVLQEIWKIHFFPRNFIFVNMGYYFGEAKIKCYLVKFGHFMKKGV